MLVLECPQWPVVAALSGRPSGPSGHGSSDIAAAVIRTNRVLAVTLAARRAGVIPGLRRREAQARCPDLEVIDDDPGRDGRAFDVVISVLESLTPTLEVVLPGRVAFATRGPARYWGGERAMVERVHDLVCQTLGSTAELAGAPTVGVAASCFAATLAARMAGSAPLVVGPGSTARFLAPLSVTALGVGGVDAGLIDLLERLGVVTLGQVAALSVGDLVARFAGPGELIWRLASGGDDRPLDARRPHGDLMVQTEIDPPAERVDRVAFTAKVMATELHDALAARGLACTRIAIELQSEHGEQRNRLWRHEGALSAAAIAQRVRWQLDGWMNGGDPPSGGISLVRLVPDEVVGDSGHQLGFWGGHSDADTRALRAIARVSAMVGRHAVNVVEWQGGRGPAEQLVLVPADTVDLAARTRGQPVVPATVSPWPGQMPTPSPATVHRQGVPAELIDQDQQLVTVSGRGVVSAEPCGIRVGDGSWRAVMAWAGPWCAEERWWDHRTHRRRARLQLVDDTGEALLLVMEGGQWRVEGVYA
jgi:protein ImuB